MAISRRTFLRRGAVTAGGAALALAPAAHGQGRRAGGFGTPQEDPAGLLDLPRGFRYRVVQTIDDRLDDGARVPGDFDGMAAHPGPQRGTTLLVRNHELNTGDLADGDAVVEGRRPYRADSPGGTTAVVVGADGSVVSSYVTSSGTRQNCAGGATPWGTWLTCEETRTDPGHGYVFEVDPRDPQSALSQTPIRDMGRFSHEAVDIDPRTGIAYLTEDDFQGDIPDDAVGEGPTSRVSHLFRYLPENRAGRPGALQEGGRLQVLTVDFIRAFNVDLAYDGDRFGVVWRDVDRWDPRASANSVGAARFQRLEGCHFAGGAFWFDDTAGGEGRHGQLFRLIPSGDPSGGGRDYLELFLEGDSAQEMDSPDNLVVAPWGDLWFVEDGDGIQRIMGVTAEGQEYEFARNRLIGLGEDGTSSEFAGPTFSPDGRTFYVNVQSPGHTFAITGPFPRANAGAARALATAAPRHRWRPRVTGRVRALAEELGLSPYEVAAYERLGVDLTR
jgi:secreted PhoX family phosphatase